MEVTEKRKKHLSGRTDDSFSEISEWWKTADKYPALREVARDVLYIPVGEVSVEGVFSSAVDVLGLRRHSMKHNTSRMLINLRATWPNVKEGKEVDPLDPGSKYYEDIETDLIKVLRENART
ncbi:unnamed protein product [Kuraishia capsulata CBS 1993]|uniref:HAT C-terminal dimerisation domain-containing protein n=1 Tax=Kuraishia capsulata CBS 1993 TaxID=1382522 RepID=W6MQX4_9ASCO|nr:uncharacterized protein KUCA_T00004743001 [Kuraishia capsulata CBS 1993]CDK28758.1 unnamed protein product [Kuraishia capsulata CBS 1993]